MSAARSADRKKGGPMHRTMTNRNATRTPAHRTPAGRLRWAVGMAFGALLAGLLGLSFTPPAAAQHALEASGIEAIRQGGGTRVEIAVMAPGPSGEREATLEMTVSDASGCFELFEAGRNAATNAFQRLCESMDKSGRRRIEMRGTMAEPSDRVGQSLNRLLAGSLEQVPSGATIDLRMLIGESGRVVGLGASVGGGPVDVWEFAGGLTGDGDTGEPQGPGTTYTLRREGLDSTFAITPREGNAALDATMTYEMAGVGGAIEASAGWLRLSDAADKDGPRRLTGRLERRAELGAGVFAGALASVDTGARYEVTFRDLPGGTAAIGVRSGEDPPLAAARADWEIEYGTDTLQPRRDVDLLAHDWRVPQEAIDGHGASMEVSFARGWTGYRGRIVGWFGEDATGYCLDTLAYRQICERLRKDGPLALDLTLDERRESAAFGWSGEVRVADAQDFGYGPWGLDVFQGSSIADWGDEEPGALYMRIRTLERQPGAEGVAWLKLVPLDRSARTIGPDGAIEGEVALAPPAPSARLGPDPENARRFPRSTPITPELTASACRGMVIAYETGRMTEDGSQFGKLDALRGAATPAVSREHWVGTLDRLWAETRPVVERFRAQGSEDEHHYCLLVGRQINHWRMGRIDEFPYPFPPSGGTPVSRGEGGDPGAGTNGGGGNGGGAGGTPVAFDPDAPNGGTHCEALQSVYSQIGSADEQNRARALLEADARMGSWRLPTTEAACATAAAIFAERSVPGF